jgi:hypothetical protein
VSLKSLRLKEGRCQKNHGWDVSVDSYHAGAVGLIRPG